MYSHEIHNKICSRFRNGQILETLHKMDVIVIINNTFQAKFKIFTKIETVTVQ